MICSYTEDHLIEQPVIQLIEHEQGWDSVNAYEPPSSRDAGLRRSGGLSNFMASAVVELTRDFFFLGAEPGEGEPGDREAAARRGEGEDPGPRARRVADGGGASNSL